MSTDEFDRVAQTSLRNAEAIARRQERFERELVSARDALADSERRLRETFDHAAVGIALASLDGRFVQVNRRFSQILGYDADELVAMTFRDITHPDDLAVTGSLVDDLLAGRRDDYKIEKRYIRKDGTTIWSHTSVALQHEPDGRPTRFVGVIEDITDRKRIEEALREETRVLDLLNSTGTALASTLEIDGLVQQVTDAATQLTGASFGAFFLNARDANGDALHLYTLSGAPREAFAGFGHPRATPIFSPTFAGGPPIRRDDILADPEYGQWGPHHGMPPGHLPVRSYLAVSVVSRTGEVYGGLFLGHPEPGVFTARAERLAVGIAAQAAIALENAKLYESLRNAARERESLLEAERAARSQAERASQLKDDFLATLSHELRTPLNAILGWSQLLATGKAGEVERTRGIDAITRNARAQAQLIEDLLDMSRIAAGKVRLDAQPLDPAAVVNAAIDSVKPAAEARGVRLHAILDPVAGPVMGDPHRLQQVVWNLLSNAVKFTPKSGIVTVLLRKHDSAVELTVADTGSGIEPEFLPYVFDRFRQADASTTRRHGGLGLGLSIVRNLVELHGGTVYAESEGKGRGARFVVRLPVPAIRTPATPEARPDRRIAAVPMPLSDLDLGGRRILVVDDDPDTRSMLAQFLGEFGAVVRTAASCDEALEAIREEVPQLLVSDIGMPERDGYELIRAIRRADADAGGRIPAIALTAFARSEDRTRAMVSGYDMHVAKPIEAGELLAAIARLVAR